MKGSSMKLNGLFCSWLVLSLVGCTNTSTTTVGTREANVELKEASMNFDLSDVQPFLQRLTQKLQLLTMEDIDRLSREIAAVPVEEERRWQFDVMHEGKTVPLKIRAFMDDVEAPDIFFFTVPGLADAIQAELISFAEDQGK
jgi:hypothetical protein